MVITEIQYHVGKLIDDAQGLNMHIDAIESWMKRNKINGSFEKIPTGYIDNVDATLALITKYKNDTALYYHLAVLLHYYMKELLKIMEERSRI